MNDYLKILFGVLACSSPIAAYADARVLTFTSLEWPPYTSSALPEQGGSSAVIRAAFKAMGYEIKVQFFPWARSMMLAERDAKITGYFPEYYSPDVTRRCMLSPPIGRGPLGLAQRTEQPVEWADVSDLSRWTVGVVQGYVNTAEFDLRVARGLQRIDPSVDDARNLLKLAKGRTELAIVDPYVFAYLSKHDPSVRNIAARLEINKRLLELKDLHVCFKKTAEGARLAALLAEGLRKIDIPSIMRSHIPEYQ